MTPTSRQVPRSDRSYVDRGILGIRLPPLADEEEQQSRRRRVDEWLSQANATLEDPWSEDARIAFLRPLPWDVVAENAVDTARRLRESFVADFRAEPCIVVHVVHAPAERVRETGAELVWARLVAGLASARFEVSIAAQRGLRHVWQHIIDTGDEWTRLDFAVTLARSFDRGARWLAAGDRPVPLDDLGFLRVGEAQARGALDSAALLFGRGQITLVTAGPWVGKSHVARSLRDRARVLVGRFQDLALHDTPTLPAWWATWRRSTAHAVWLIDGLDEVLHARGEREALRFAHEWGELSEDERKRLTLVVFSRPDATRDALRRACPRLVELSLLPVDRHEAAHALGLPPAGFLALADKIRALGDTPLRSQIKALEVLRDTAGDLSARDLRRAVLEREVTAPARAANEIPVAPSTLLHVASALALATFVCQEEVLQFGNHGTGLDVAALFLHAPESVAVARALTLTPAFVRDPGGHRFALQFLREQLAAAWLSEQLKRSATAPWTPAASVWREVLANDDGIRESMRAVADVLRDDEAARPLLRELETPPPLSERDIGTRLEALVAAARKGRPFLRDRLERLSRLSSPGTKERAWELLLEGDLALRELGLALLAADPTPADAARLTQIATDERENGDLRHAIVFLLLRADELEQERPRLYRHVVDGGLRAEGLRAARAAVLLDASNRGAPLGEVVAQADPSERGSIDHRSLLLSELARRLQEDTEGGNVARDLVDAWCGGEKAGRQPGVVRALLSASIERLAMDATSPGDDVRFRHVLETDDWEPDIDDVQLRKLVEARLVSEPTLRRMVFEGASERVWQSSWPHLAEDDDWLVEHASSLVRMPPSVERAVAALAFREVGASASARALLETRGLWHGIAARRRVQIADAEDWRRRTAQRVEPPSRPHIRDLVPGAFAHEAPEDAVRYLGAAFFAGDWARGGVDGSLRDLGEETQEELIEHARACLANAVPTPLPEEGELDRRHFLESATFAAAVAFDEKPWLSHELVQRWLPAVLRVGMDRLTVTLDRCGRAAPDVTMAVVSRELETRAATDASHVASRLPAWFWREGHLTEKVETILRDDSAFVGHPDGLANRRRLLGTIAHYHPASPVLVELARHRGDLALADEAFGLALRASPTDALRRVEPDPERRAARLSGDRLLAIVTPLFQDDGSSASVIARWSAEDLVALLVPLVRNVAETSEVRPVGQMYTVDALIRAAEGRDRLLRALLQRASKEPAAKRCAEQLRVACPALDAVITSHLATDAVDAALAADRPLSVAEASELLREGPRLPIRTTGVFFQRLIEVFQALGADSRADAVLVMDRDGAGAEKPGHEVSSLQAYLHRRIKDRWSSASMDERLEWEWSPMVNPRTMPDFLAVLGSMKIPVEVKWSHHPRVSTAYRTQLAEAYCKRLHSSFGIYVVARSALTSDSAWREIEVELARTRSELRPSVCVDHVLLDFRPYVAASDRGGGGAKPKAGKPRATSTVKPKVQKPKAGKAKPGKTKPGKAKAGKAKPGKPTGAKPKA